ncbi:hypothetical protein GCM10008083_16890 [Ulvibacter litoralis]|nr:hypothetical protein GCM10008083_16890 [Ulvibacter litoralis]
MLSLGMYAQSRATLDSIRAEATLLTYSNPQLAIKKGLQLYEMAKNDPSSQTAALITVANAYAILKNHEKVLTYAFRADSVAEKSNNYADRVRVLGFIGGEYQRLKLGNKALSYLDKAYEITVNHPLPDSIKFLQGNIVFVKGLIQKDNLGCEYALEYLKEAEVIFKNNTTNKAINSSIGIANNNIGDCNFELKEYAAAKENYEEAIFYGSKVNSTKIVAYSELGLSKILTVEGKNLEAIHTLQEALKSIEHINDISMNSEIYKALSDNYSIVEDTENFNKYTSLYLAEEAKLLSEEKKSLNTIVNDISLDNSEKSEAQKNKYNYFFIFSIIVLLLLLLYILKNILKKRKKIAQHKEKIDSSEKNDN